MTANLREPPAPVLISVLTSHPPPSGGAFSGSNGPAGGGGGGLKHLPATAYLCFDSAPPAEGLGRKLREFSSQLAATPDMQHLALSEAQVGS